MVIFMSFQETARLSSGEALVELAEKAARNKVGGLNYGGDISPAEAFSYIKNNQSFLIDVRTIPEWQFVGVPNLDGAAGKLLTLSWKHYPSFSLNAQFVDSLAADDSINKDTALFFLCRSGGRSLDAAVAMTEAGYDYCFNIEGGFEGEADASGHRGTAGGWKAANLPWIQK
jgi:rhodanese-related sulfurtransferase